jgi:hypothetical protein
LESAEVTSREEFRRRLKAEWNLMWTERYDDRQRSEGVAVDDYPLLFMDRGFIVFATRNAKTPVFAEIVDYWAAQGLVYSPEPDVGGWGRFIRTELKRVAHSRAARHVDSKSEGKKGEQHLKKGGRGWLHA